MVRRDLRPRFEGRSPAIIPICVRQITSYSARCILMNSSLFLGWRSGFDLAGRLDNVKLQLRAP